MSALSSLVRIPTTPRRQRAAVTVALGLSAGAVGWSGLAQAAGEETASQVLLLWRGTVDAVDASMYADF